MEKILILAYYFPPLGMGGTQRTAKFVKFLPEFGWIPYVVTVKEVAYYAKDPTLLEEIRSARIYRTGSLDPQRLLFKLGLNKSRVGYTDDSWTGKKWQFINKAVSWFFIPDSKLLWLPFALIRAWQLIKKENISGLLTTSPPHSIHLAGLFLQRLLGVFWVADFRDGWSGGNFQYEPTILHRVINRRLERMILRRADRVVGASSKLVDYFRRQVSKDESKFYTVRNGFDSEDLGGLQNPRRNEKFTITFCGAIGPTAPVDSFLRSLSDLFKKRPGLRKQIVVKLIGTDWDGHANRTVRMLGLEGVVCLPGYLAHRLSLQELIQADLLLYPIANWVSSDFIPGKTYEYLASGNPILVVGPVVEGVEILRQTAEVTVTGHDDLGSIEQTLLGSLATFKQGSRKRRETDETLTYERKQQARSLGRILDSLFDQNVSARQSNKSSLEKVHPESVRD